MIKTKEGISKNKIIGIVSITVAIALIVGLAVGIPLSQKTDYVKRAKIILDKYPLIDGHNDIASMIRKNFQNQFDRFDFQDMTKFQLDGTDGVTHTDIKRLKESKLGGQFWAVYASCESLDRDAIRIHLEQLDLLNRLIKKYPEYLQPAKNVKEIREAFKNKKVASLLGLESGHAIDSSLGILRVFYNLGVRYMTLTHNCDTAWATNNLVNKNSNSSDYGGLTEFGKLVIKEMNRIGMIADLSHVSSQTMIDVLKVSQAPVMFSHSSVFALCDHTRNVNDDVLKLLKQNGGVIMINFFNGFVNCNEDKTKTTVKDVMSHINYVKKLIGVDHIGIGSDYDGVPRVPEGLEDVSKYTNLFAELLKNGWTEAELGKIAGENILRVLEEVENVSTNMKKTVQPVDDLIPEKDLTVQNKKCRSSF